MHVHYSVPSPTTRKKTVFNPPSYMQIENTHFDHPCHTLMTQLVYRLLYRKSCCYIESNDVISRTRMTYREQECHIESKDVISRPMMLYREQRCYIENQQFHMPKDSILCEISSRRECKKKTILFWCELCPVRDKHKV